MTVFDLIEKLMDYHPDDVVSKYSYEIEKSGEGTVMWDVSCDDVED